MIKYKLNDKREKIINAKTKDIGAKVQQCNTSQKHKAHNRWKTLKWQSSVALKKKKRQLNWPVV